LRAAEDARKYRFVSVRSQKGIENGRSVKRALPHLNALVVLEAAVRSASFTVAAAELNIAPSAVSRHVATLEQQTGLQLFARNGNRVAPTPEGLELGQAVRTGLGSIVEALDRLTAQRSTLLIGCSHEVAQAWLMPRFPLILAHATGRQVQLLASTDYELFDRSGVELSIRFGRPADWPGTAAWLLQPGVWFPVCAPGLLARLPQLRGGSRAALRAAPLLHLEERTPKPYGWPDWLGETTPLAGPIFSSHQAVLHEALAGRGVALAWAGFDEAYLEAGQLVRLSDEARTADESFYLVTPDWAAEGLQALVQALIGSAAPDAPHARALPLQAFSAPERTRS
jgi:LysR family glycine cleavage system transcriptional activator